MHEAQGSTAHSRGTARYTQMIVRAAVVSVAVTFAVVGIAAPSSAHHNTITGTVACATGGGWAVSWQVVNSEQDKTETIIESNRPSAVPVGTVLGFGESRLFTETITTKPTAALDLTLKGYWSSTGVKQENSGSIPVEKFTDNCNVTTVSPPTVPVVDECGPGNAVYGQVPTGPWTSTANPDGSLTVVADPGYSFGNGQTSVTYPTPTDSNQPCPVVTPPVVTPPVVTPPVVTPPVVIAEPEVQPAQVRLVKAEARQIDKCGRASDLFKVAKRSGVVYKSDGKVLRQGVWIKAKTRSVTVRAQASDATVQLRGKRLWKMTFTSKPCAKAPEIAPNTGS